MGNSLAMKQAHLLDIVRALNLAAVRYLIVGGIAVNVHGYLRHTKDVDLVIALDEPNCRAAMDAVASFGRPASSRAAPSDWRTG